MLGVERRTSTVRHIITEESVRKFGEISGDLNPLHFDKDFAERTRFGKPIAHGALYTSFISEALFKLGLPEEYVVFCELHVVYIRPVFMGDEIEAKAEMIGADEEKLEIKCEWINQNDKKVAVGSAKILIEPLIEILKKQVDEFKEPEKHKLQVVQPTAAAEQVA